MEMQTMLESSAYPASLDKHCVILEHSQHVSFWGVCRSQLHEAVELEDLGRALHAHTKVG
jgi:hypothetical protein